MKFHISWDISLFPETYIDWNLRNSSVCCYANFVILKMAGWKIHHGWRKIRYGWRKKFRHQWRNNLQWAAEKSTMVEGKILHFWQKFSPWRRNSVLWFVTIFLENSAAGRLWSCGMPSLAWNYLESFLQCTCFSSTTYFLSAKAFIFTCSLLFSQNDRNMCLYTKNYMFSLDQ